MKKSGKQLLAMLLCLTMLLTMLPMSALSFQEEGAPAASVEELEEDKGAPEGEDIEPTDGKEESGEKIVPVSDGDMSDSASSEAESGDAQENSVLTGDEESSQPENVFQENSVLTGAEESDGQDWDGVQLFASQTAPDGATADTWVQIEGSKRGDAVEPSVDEEGRIVLSATSGNDNNFNSSPAIFVDTDMNKTLSALGGSADKTLSFTLTPSGSGSWMGFGIVLRYDGTTGSSVKGYHIGYNNGGWFTQNYGATPDTYPSFTGPALTANTPVDFEITWSDSGISSFKIGGQSITLDSSCTLDSVPAITGDNTSGLKGVAFKAGNYGSATTLRLSNVHYTGQAPVTAYDVTGTVTDAADSSPIEGVTVSAGSVSTTTGADGKYTLALPNGTYTLKASKEGYKSKSETVTVNSADVTQNVQLTKIVVGPAEGWVQIVGSKVTGSVDPKTEDGEIVLSSAAANGNNLDGQNPAIFVDTNMNKALSALPGDRSKALSFTLTPSSSGSWLGFALLLRYDGTTGSGVKAYHIGYPSGETTGWFTQNYGADTVHWPGFTGPVMTAGQPVNFEITWNDSGISSFKIGGEAVTLPATHTFMTVPALEGENPDGLKGVAFKVSTKNNNTTTLRLSNIKYTGNGLYDVSGTVSGDDGSSKLEDVTVTANPGGMTAKTNAQGVYTFQNLPVGSYTLSFAKEGYQYTGTKTVTVSNAHVTGQDVTMTETDIIEIPVDGVNNGDWKQVESTKVTGAVEPEVKNGELLLTSGRTNGNKLANNTAVFTSDKMTQALGTVSGERWVSFTLTPECMKNADKSNVTDYLAFGIVLNASGGNTGYGISFTTEEADANKWLIQHFKNGVGSSYGTPAELLPKIGQPMEFKITWTDDAATIQINGKTLTHSVEMTGMTRTNTVAFTVGGKDYNDLQLQNEPRQTRLRISNLQYSGQETVPARYVSGKVTSGGKGLADVAVTLQGAGNEAYKTTTKEDGAYKLAVPVKAETQTIRAEKDGYAYVEKTVTVAENTDKAQLENVDFALTEMPKITGTVLGEGDTPLRAVISSDLRPGKSVTCDETGRFTLIGAVQGEHTLTVSAEGYETKEVKVTVEASDVDAGTIRLAAREVPSYILSTAGMEVKVHKNFPQVIKYTMKGDLTGEMYGQSAELDTIKINGKAVKPVITSRQEGSGKAVYTMVIDASNNNGTDVTATITAELRVGLEDLNDPTSKAASRTLGFFITGVEYAGATEADKAANRLAHPVDTIEIPNHSLVSVRSTEPTATVKGAKLAANTITSGDTSYNAKGNEDSGKGDNPYFEDFFAAFVYNDKFSAGLSSNSAYAAGGAAGDKCYPVRAQFDAKDGGVNVAIGLGSTLWYYDHDITRDEHGDDQKLTMDQLSREQRIIAPLEMPYAKVVITGDANGNGTVDWQDGAIAYRETVMHIPAGGEGVANSANLRISMNFGSMATNPFLIALDNVKRVAAHTDGLGQFVLLKGYAGEGHDSNHPQYDNIGERMGGKEDFVTLIREGGELGATFGIHTNASEFYTEAIQEENQVRRYTNGGIHYGWNWLDQGIAINGVYDYATGLQKGRWDALYQIVTRDLVKDHPFVVYVDVWGNNTSGTENDFMTRALSQNIVGHDGWRIAHEWAYANPYESTFQHWTTDYTYGNYSDKGKLNSEVIRFILNQYKDSFTADFANYGGAANAPLLGGPAMQGFEGWQGDGEYDLSIYNTYNQMIYTKFLQHYPVVEWIDSENTVNVPYSVNNNGSHQLEQEEIRNNKNELLGGYSAWRPEMQIRLSDGKDEIVVTRGLDATLDTQASFSMEKEVEYRSRVVTLNGKVIVEGAPASAGEDNSFPRSKATLKYLIPWYWDNKGDRVTAENEKLYHWNAQGGESIWDLPNGWEGLTSVMVYELSDQGRGPGKSVRVVNGKVTLTGIKANTGYVVTKGADKGAGPVIDYGTGLHLSDPSFNLDMPRSPWKVEGNGSAMRATNSEGISVLKMIGQVSVSQKLTGLAAGKTYAMYAAVDNRSNAKATMTITDGEGNMVATNYTEKSIARNYISSYYLHNNHGMEKGESYFQNMFLYFTPEAGKEYTLTLSREAGSGNVYFDDIRTVEYKGTVSPVEYDAQTGAATELHQDFENVPQGIWPFVVGPKEGVADNRVHLSELNEPYTQAGWDVKEADDVIDGKWSVKANGLWGGNTLVYQTIPQNFRFEPNKVYKVSFDYEMGFENGYGLVVGDGAYSGISGLTVYTLEKTMGGTASDNGTAKANVGHIEITVIGSESGQTWVGIYGKEKGEDGEGKPYYGSRFAFNGTKDFVLDNLTIELASPEKNELAFLLREADLMIEEVYLEEEANAWTAFTTARTAGHSVFDDENATADQVSQAVTDLRGAIAKLTKINVTITGTVKNTNGAPAEGVVLTLEDDDYRPVGMTFTTGADGAFQFAGKDGIELLPATYHIKAQGTGYLVSTTDAIEVTKTDSTKTVDITLNAEAPGAYVNDFNNGDISMIGALTDTADIPTWEVVEFDGSKALKVTFHSTAGETRGINNVVDKSMKIKNGTVSFDVTGLTNTWRLGVTLRALDPNTRIFVGQEDAEKKWFWEWWNGSPTNTSYDAVTPKAIGAYPMETRRIRVELSEQNVQMFIDGVQIYNATMNGAPDEAGWVGINMRGNPGTSYILDNLRIVSTDPVEGVQSVSGTITARSGVVVSGAAVDLYDGATRVTGTTTNALGQYKLTGVEAGGYTMKVSAPFFAAQEKEITVVDNTDLEDQDFILIPDISTLTTLIQEVKALKEDDYTPETWAPLAEALAEAEKIDGTSSIAALNTAYRALSNAKEALVEREPAPTDYSGLRTLYNEMALKEETDYTPESWSGFQTALEKALEILSKDATQQEVDDAAAALQSAYAALERETGEEPLSLAALQAAYDAARNVTNDNYTDASWAAFTAARDRALEILTNADGLTQAQVDAAAKALTDARQALTKKSGGSSSSSSSGKDRDKTVTKKNEDGSVTTTVTKPDGTVTETTVDTDGGKVEKVTTPDKAVEITVTDPQGETLANVAIPAVIPVPETRFADVPQGHWADEAIHHAAGLELVEGVGNNRYDMETPMTRGSLATVLHRLSQGKTDYEVVFSDVEQGKYYTQGVAWAARVNVVKGVSKDLFAPDQIITREQLAVMLARYAKLIGMDTKADAKALNAFQDGGNAGTWAVDGLAWCVEKGILKGKGGSVLDPTADVSRAEVAVMLDRFITLIK